MRPIVLVLTTGALLLASAAAVARLRLPGLVRSVFAVLLLALVQIMAVVLVAGALLQSLYPSTVVVLALATSTLLVGGSCRRTGVRALARAWRDAVRACWHDGCGRRMLFRSPWALVLGTYAAAQAAYTALAAFVFPPYAWDGLSYHLPAVAYWVQNGRIGITPYWLYSNVYPSNAELVFAWPTVLLRDDTLIDAGQLAFAVLGSLSIAVVARSLGLRRSSAIVAASLFLVTPIVLLQSNAAYTDVAVAGGFLAAFACWFCALQELGLVRGGLDREPAEARRLGRIDLVLGGLAAGMAIGTKTSAIAYVGVLGAVLVGLLVAAVARKRLGWRSAAGALMLFVLPMPVLGTFWYARNWVEYGNPLHPFTVAVAGHELFSGQGTPEETVLAGMVPPTIDGESWPEQVWHSWTHAPTEFEGYGYDQRLGGLGLTWVFLAFPALVVFAGYACVRRRDLLFALVVPFTLVFLVQPLRWWSRFTIVIVAPGVLAVVFLAELLRGGWARWVRVAMQLGAVGLVASLVVPSTQRLLIGATLDPQKLWDVARLPASRRTIGHVALRDWEWADLLPDGSRIGTRLRDVPNAWVYPLFGRRLQRHLVMLPDVDDEASIARELARHRLDYVLARKDETLDSIVRRNPERFQLLFETRDDRLYDVVGEGATRS